MKKGKSSSGFIGTIILIVIGLIVLKFAFHFDLIQFLKSPDVATFFSYIKKFFQIIWFKYIGGFFWYIWDNIVVDIVWKTIHDGYELLKTYVNNN